MGWMPDETQQKVIDRLNSGELDLEEWFGTLLALKIDIEIKSLCNDNSNTDSN